MITTVTLNPSIDASWFVDTFGEEDINRVTDKKDDAGGKGINISRFLAKFGVETLATGLVGGHSGIHLRDLLEKDNVPHVFVNLQDGETRTNVTLFVRDGNRTIKINQPGPTITDGDLDALKQLLLSSMKHSRFIAFSGKNPPGTNNRLVLDMLLACKRAGAGISLDSESYSKDELIELKPLIFKPNEEELGWMMGRKLNEIGDLAEAARSLCSQGVGYVVVSMGKDGLLGVSASKTYRVSAPKINVRSTVGAGDSVVSGFLMATYDGADFPDALAKGAACGSAMAATYGTEIPDREAVIELEKKAEVKEI